MMNFITAILRNQFNLFYRFGYTFIPNEWLIEFDGIISEEISDKVVDLFKMLPPFQYDEEYVILHLEKRHNSPSKTSEFQIQDLVAVYPLSAKAKFSIASKLDTRINLNDPIFESKLDLIVSSIYQKEIIKAISALWLIAGYQDDVKTYMESIGIDNILNGINFRKEGVKANKIKNSNYWSYLMAYDRYDYFPNTLLGYFYDAGQVFAYSKGLESFEGSGLHKFLENIRSSNPNDKFDQIIKKLEFDQSIRDRYISQTSNQDYKIYIIAPLFFLLKDEIKDTEELTNTKLFQNLSYIKSTFGEQFKYSLVLLGAFFGYEKFYDAYYDKLNLRFYKTYKVQDPTLTPILEIPSENNVVNEENNDQEIQSALTLKDRSSEYDESLDANKDILRLSDQRDFSENMQNGVDNPEMVSSGKTTSQNSTLANLSNVANSIPNDKEIIGKSSSSRKNKYLETILSILDSNKGEAKLSELVKMGQILSISGKSKLTISELKNDLEGEKEIVLYKKGNTEMVKFNSQPSVEPDLFGDKLGT